MFTVYILFSEKHQRTYVGFTEDLVARLKRHNGRLVTASAPYAPWEVLYTESCDCLKDAKAREQYWKSGGGRRKLKQMYDSRPSLGEARPQ